MNDRNRDLFFSDNDDEVAMITMIDEDGNESEAALVACFEIEDMDREYAVLMPVEQDEEDLENGEGEVILMIYEEDVLGDPSFEPIEDEDEFEAVQAAFYNLMENGEIELETEMDGDL